MSTSEVSKVAVVDPRIVQQRPAYAVEKGAVSLTNGKYSAIANSISSQTYNVQVPSENVFVDRAVDWTQRVYAVITLTMSANATQNVPILIPGVNMSLAPFPSHQCVSTMSATINDSTVTINTSDVLPQVLRLSDMAAARKQRTCPTQLDKLYSVPETVGFRSATGTYLLTPQSVLSSSGGGYGESASATEDVACGSWPDFRFEAQTAGAGDAYSLAVAGYEGLPCPTGAGDDGPFLINCSWRTTEKLVLPPFIFGDEYELSTGLFGVQNIQLTVNMAASPARALRFAPTDVLGAAYASAPAVTYNTTLASPFSEPVLNVQFLTPPIEVDLPAKSVVPWMEFPRYISPTFTAASGTALVPVTTDIQSQTITLPSIPDLLMVYVKPQSYATSLVGDWVLPISQISVNFDNFSGLLASHTQEELYKMSFRNGVDMDWATWSGACWSGLGKKLSTVGGPLVLRPGRDFPLQSGQAPGLVGNFTFQFTGRCVNTTGGAQANVSIYVVAVNSGFFETIKGSSRIIKGILTETDILGATQVAGPEPLTRMVGSAKKLGMMKKSNPLSSYM
jgi:hypothetical protein